MLMLMTIKVTRIHDDDDRDDGDDDDDDDDVENDAVDPGMIMNVEKVPEGSRARGVHDINIDTTMMLVILPLTSSRHWF